MEATKWSYFQFRKNHQYKIYIKFKQDELNPKFSHLLQELGFSALDEGEVKKVQLQKDNSKMLTVQEASARLQLQIHGSDILDKYGPESLSLHMGVPLYTFRRVGVMGQPVSKSLWDLAIHSDISQTDQMVGLRIILVRFLSQALAEQGIISYWGTLKEDTIYMMKQAQSFGEAVFIDLQKRMIFYNGGEAKLGPTLKIIRRDQEAVHSSLMSREDLIGFMSVSTCLMSFNGITPAMKKNIYELSSRASGSYATSENLANL
jgi:hypothetical protein